MISTLLKQAGLLVGTALLTKGAEALADKAVTSGVDGVLALAKRAVATSTDANYITKTKATRLEPFVLIDKKCVIYPELKAVLNTAQKLFAAYYTMSVAVDNKIGNVTIGNYLDHLSTNRSPLGHAVNMLSTEAYQFGLPFVGRQIGIDRYKEYSQEAAMPNGIAASMGRNEELNELLREKQDSSTVKVSETKDVDNLAVGMSFTVTVGVGDKTIQAPIMLRLNPIEASSTNIVKTLTFINDDESFTDTWKKFRLGEYEFWRDVIKGQNKIDQYRDLQRDDKTGYLASIASRKANNSRAALLSGKVSVGDVSSIWVVSRDTIRDFEEKSFSRIDDYTTRETIFSRGACIMLFIINTDEDTVTIYTKDIERGSTYSIRDIKSSNKTNSDATELMKILLSGRMPGRL